MTGKEIQTLCCFLTCFLVLNSVLDQVFYCLCHVSYNYGIFSSVLLFVSCYLQLWDIFKCFIVVSC